VGFYFSPNILKKKGDFLMALWMVRAGQYGENENFALENGVAVIGWDDPPNLCAAKSFEEIKNLLVNKRPDISPKTLPNFSGQIWAFVGRIQIGDFVALPLKTRSAVALGKVTGECNYNPDFPVEAKHFRKVDWIRNDVPRDQFRQDLLYSLGAFMTVCQIKRNNAESRVQAMLDGSIDPYLEKKAQEVEVEEEIEINIQEYAQDQIRSYIGANYKGHELTRLVTSLLKAQGYKTFMSPPGPDGGVDIVAGRGALGFDKPRLCVQVKSGATPVDVSAFRELQGVMKNFGAEQGLFVSWSGFKETVHREARVLYFEIRLWDADKLVNAIFENYEKLPEEIQTELPLKRIWALVQEE
jgi:restriction system protein